MSLTIPLAMVADMVIHGRHYSAIYILGSVQLNSSFKEMWFIRFGGDTVCSIFYILFMVYLQVFAGFVIANLSNWFSRKLGL